MRRLCRALRLYFRSPFTWARCWELAKPQPRYHIVARDNLLYLEPRIPQRRTLGKKHAERERDVHPFGASYRHRGQVPPKAPPPATDARGFRKVGVPTDDTH